MIVRNLILQSPATGAYYFVPKGEDMGNGVTRVIGRKVDVTESIKALFGPHAVRRMGPAPRPRKPKTASR